MLRQALQSYLDRVFPYSKIDTEHTLGGQVHIRFELGEGQPNGTKERVRQAADRALAIFNDTFNNLANELFVLTYDYQGEGIYKSSSEYLYQQFPTDGFKLFYQQLEQVNSRYFTTDENGQEVLEKIEANITIGKLPVKDIHIKNILNGIANNEMGFDTAIGESIYFFDPSSDRGFQMYDDRGCYVWSDKADKIRDLFLKRNDWIAEYHRPEIEAYFR